MRLIDGDALVYELTKLIRHSTGEYKYGLEAARLTTSEAPTIGVWISADTYPNTAGQRYLLTVRNVHGDVRVIIGYTGYWDALWYTSDQNYMEDYHAGDNRLSHNYVVTHWMPLPELPKEDAP